MLDTKQKITLFSDWLALLWGAVIGYLSLSPLPALPALPVSDKLEHFAAYGVLGFLGVLSRTSRYGIFSTLTAIVVYGGAIEFIQPYFNRYMELGDFIANTSGAMFGAAIGITYNRTTGRNL